MGVGMPWGQWTGFSVLAWKGHAPWLGWGWAYGLRQGVVVLWSFWKALLLHHPCPHTQERKGAWQVWERGPPEALAWPLP